MGFFRDLIKPESKAQITAQLAPPVVADPFNFYSQFTPFQSVGREEAISVPSVMRCRNLIATGYAWEYGGGTKVKDFDALLAKRNSNNGKGI